MLFSDLLKAELEAYMLPDIERLLEIKINHAETEKMLKIMALNQYIDESLQLLKEQADALPQVKAKGYEELDRLFCHFVVERQRQLDLSTDIVYDDK
jgi:hypothetical protein